MASMTSPQWDGMADDELTVFDVADYAAALLHEWRTGDPEEEEDEDHVPTISTDSVADSDSKMINSLNPLTQSSDEHLIVAVEKHHDACGVPSTAAFLTRMHTLLDVPKYCLLSALIYIRRLLEGTRGTYLSSSNLDVLTFTAVMLATKFHSDVPRCNRTFAMAAGRDLAEVNRLEVEFLRLIRWDLYIQHEEFQAIYCDVRACASPSRQIM